MTKTLKILILLSVCWALPLQAELIKKSRSGICHNQDSPHYSRTKNFRAFESLLACIQSGGRLPKNQISHPTQPAVKQNISTRYQREAFGQGWSDNDRDCLNTRHELLMSQSTSTTDRGRNPCTITRGRWLDPYTGKTFYQASDVDIDHLVPLKWAWDHGASHWPSHKRERFANDPANLFIVEDSVNQAKGAKGPLEWLPPLPSFHCQYLTRFQRVVVTYRLGETGQEADQWAALKKQVCGR